MIRACMKLITQAIDIYGSNPGNEQKHKALIKTDIAVVLAAFIPISILFSDVFCAFGGIVVLIEKALTFVRPQNENPRTCFPAGFWPIYLCAT